MDYIELIARVCHEANRAYCESIGDMSQRQWYDADQWQRDSAIMGVKFRMENPQAGQSAQHDAWCQQKINDGWTYDEIKDANRKTHPCLVSYDQLPILQQRKDALFQSIVDALK